MAVYFTPLPYLGCWEWTTPNYCGFLNAQKGKLVISFNSLCCKKPLTAEGKCSYCKRLAVKNAHCLPDEFTFHNEPLPFMASVFTHSATLVLESWLDPLSASVEAHELAESLKKFIELSLNLAIYTSTVAEGDYFGSHNATYAFMEDRENFHWAAIAKPLSVQLP